ncbi:hypothetical protein BC940DRAFT_297238 [Gongronella butleri]|nr:hypothetical protein BC940DRAFT_297238 [Gongronella butleri]
MARSVFFLVLLVACLFFVTSQASDLAEHAHTVDLVARKSAKTFVWANPPILLNGTLFYIAISISTLLWCTGKGVHMAIDQQERRAAYLACR